MVLIVDGREVGPGLSLASLLDRGLFPDLSARTQAALEAGTREVAAR